MNRTTVTAFLTGEEIEHAKALRHAKLICDEIIQPNIDRINKALGQRNDPMYLAYGVEHVVAQMEGK